MKVKNQKHRYGVGIDISLTATGMALVIDGKLKDTKLIKSKKVDDSYYSDAIRIDGVYKEIVSTYMEYRGEIEVSDHYVAIEGLAFMARNTSALAQLSAINYMIRIFLISIHQPFLIVAPTSLKKFITGKGNVQKDIMMLETYKTYDVSLTDDNLCDAHGLAQIACVMPPYHGKMTVPQQEVLDLLSSKQTSPYICQDQI